MPDVPSPKRVRVVTLEQLAEECGLSYPRLLQCWWGKKPITLDDLLKIREFTGMSLDECYRPFSPEWRTNKDRLLVDSSKIGRRGRKR